MKINFLVTRNQPDIREVCKLVSILERSGLELIAMTLEVWVLACREGIYRRISSLGPARNNLLSKPYPEPSPKP